MLTLNTIRAQPGANTKRKRLGRGQGSGLGQTGGRGGKGQTARTGSSIPHGFEGGQMPLYRRIPKRGFTNIHRLARAVINVGDLEQLSLKEFPEISLSSLKNAKLARSNAVILRVLGEGELTKSFLVKADGFSKSALEKIQKAGGKVEVVKPKRTTKQRKKK